MSDKDKNEPIVKRTEIKLLLDEDTVLKDKFILIPEFIEAFNIENEPANMKIWYLDTPAQGFNKENWSVRFRYHDNCDLELTFKKRYERNYSNTDIVPDEALNKSLLDDGFEPEMDLGVHEKTLSLSYVKKFPMQEEYLSLSLDEAKKLALKNSPQTFDNWKENNWGFNTLNNSIFWGPVNAVEYKGTCSDYEINLEIWKLGSYFPELSFDVKSKKAREAQRELLDILYNNGWLLPKDILKTQLLYQYFSKTNINKEAYIQDYPLADSHIIQ